jgi:hypothetical protein
MTVHRHGLSYAGPVPEGHTRCLSVQPPDVVAGLIDSGEHRPRLRLAEQSSEYADCRGCQDDDQWCYLDANRWVVGEAARRLNRPQMGAAVWLNASGDFARDQGWIEHRPGHFLLVLDVPTAAMVRFHADLFRWVVSCDAPIPPASVRGAGPWEEFVEARRRYARRFPPDIASWDLDLRVQWLRPTWEHVFDDALWGPDGFDHMGDHHGRTPLYGLTPSIQLAHVRDVVVCHAENGRPGWRSLGDVDELRTRDHVMLLNHAGVVGISSESTGLDHGAVDYAAVQGPDAGRRDGAEGVVA